MSLNNADNFFYSKIMPFLTISNHQENHLVFTLFSIFTSCYALIFYSCLISWLLCFTNKILRATDLLFDSDSLQSFLCDGKSTFFQLYWLIKGLVFDFLSEWILICLLFSAIIKAYWKHLSYIFQNCYHKEISC